MQALQARIEALPSTPPIRSWATVAASGDSPPPQPNHRRPAKDQNCIRINTQQSFVDPRDNNNNSGNTFGRYLPTETANTHIRTALLNTPPTQDAQVAGVGTMKTGYIIRFKDQASTNAAHSNPEWLNELGNDTRLAKPRFGIIIYRTPTEDFDLENANAHAIEKVMEENELTERGFQIKEVAWLKKKDKALGKFASLGRWFDSAEDADLTGCWTTASSSARDTSAAWNAVKSRGRDASGVNDLDTWRGPARKPRQLQQSYIGHY